MSHAIIPGSFDPMTLGHLALIKTVAKQYDRVTVAVMINAAKQYLLDKETRVAIARATVAALPNVEVISDDGMLIDLFDRIGADAVCKGWRNERDYAYECEMAEWNCAHNPRFHTVLLQSEGEYRTLSSTEVREMLARGESLTDVVHADSIPLILDAVQRKDGISC